LEGGTKEEIRIFEALFKGVSTLFGLRTIEKYIENLDFIFCQSFQNLRLGSIDLVTSKKWDVLEALFIHQKQVLLNGRTSYWGV
jgi:hypothetical protein